MTGPLQAIILLTLMWFVIYWMLGGVMFAVVALVKFMRINKAQFSCLFAVSSGIAAYAAAWMGVAAAQNTSLACIAKIKTAYLIIPGLFRCASREVIATGILWFILLMATGIIIMFISRVPENGRHTSHTPPRV